MGKGRYEAEVTTCENKKTIRSKLSEIEGKEKEDSNSKHRNRKKEHQKEKNGISQATPNTRTKPQTIERSQ